MKEIEEKLADLYQCYVDQHRAYAQVLTTASEEAKYIELRDMNRLLPVLERKQEAVAAAGSQEARIEDLQRQLAAVFRLENFSLEKLGTAAPARYQERIRCIQAEVEALLVALEKVEAQERIFEMELKKIADSNPNNPQEAHNTAKKLAQRAYQKEK